MTFLEIFGSTFTFFIRGLAITSLVIGLLFCLLFDVVFGALTVDTTLGNIWIAAALSLAISAVTTVVLHVPSVIYIPNETFRLAYVAVGWVVRLADSLLDAIFFYDKFSLGNRQALPPTHFIIVEWLVFLFAVLISLTGERLALWVVQDGLKTTFEKLLGVSIGGGRSPAPAAESHVSAGSHYVGYSRHTGGRL